VKKSLVFLLIFSIVFVAFACDNGNSENIGSAETTVSSTTKEAEGNTDETEETTNDAQATTESSESILSLDRKGKIFINDVDVTDICYVDFDTENKYAKVGIISLSKALGAEISWQSETVANITINDTVYVLDIQKKTLYSPRIVWCEDTLSPIYGYSYDPYRESIYNDLIVDITSLDPFLPHVNVSWEADIDNLTLKLKTLYSTEPWKLIINGKDVTENCYVGYDWKYQQAKLGVIAVLQELGVELNWQSESVASISINGDLYILNLNEKTLKGPSIFGENENLLVGLPGTYDPQTIEVVDNELIVSEDLLGELFSQELLNVSCHVDPETLTVTIKSRE